jgi:hypothetical protein
MKRWIFQGILFFIAFFAVERFCHEETHGFRLQKIRADLPSNPDWDTQFPEDHQEKKLQGILSQPFYFLNSGGEAYAFVSKDGKYVLKFFKLHHMRPYNFSDVFLPHPLRVKCQKMRKKKLTTLFSSCKLAYERFRERTGLIYLHLNKTDFLHVKLKIFDAIGAVHHLQLDKLPFALQEKALLAYPTLSSLAEAQEWDAAKRRISSLLDLIVARCRAGLADRDARKRNFGFIGDHAIEIDLGSFRVDESLKTKTAMEKVLLHETLKLRRYIKKRHPQLSEYFEEKLKTHLT